MPSSKKPRTKVSGLGKSGPKTVEQAPKTVSVSAVESPEDAPKIEFPCADYPIKSMGAAGTEFYQLVVEIMERHAPGFDQTAITVRESSKGSFQSITVFITATGVAQLESIHQDLKASSLTKIVL